MSKISDDARKMKQYLEDNGWIQGTDIDYNTGGVCLVGSMAQSGVGWLTSWPTEPVIMAIAEQLGCYVHEIPQWNDQPGRTYVEIKSVLEDVAIKYADDAYHSEGS